MEGIAIITSGGDAAGMNPAIKCAVEHSRMLGYKPFLVYNGLRGLIDDNIEEAGPRGVRRDDGPDALLFPPFEFGGSARDPVAPPAAAGAFGKGEPIMDQPGVDLRFHGCDLRVGSGCSSTLQPETVHRAHGVRRSARGFAPISQGATRRPRRDP